MMWFLVNLKLSLRSSSDVSLWCPATLRYSKIGTRPRKRSRLGCGPMKCPFPRVFSSIRQNDTILIYCQLRRSKERFGGGVFGDAKVGLYGGKGIEPPPSRETFQRLLKPPQKASEGSTRGEAALGDGGPQNGFERVGWRRFWS